MPDGFRNRAFALAALVGSGGLACVELRTAPIEGTLDAGPAHAAASSPVPSSVPPLSVDPRTARLVQVEDLPAVDYRAVKAFSPSRAVIVGDETILDWRGGTDWTITPVSGALLTSVWGDETVTFAVGTLKDTNTGVIMIKSPKGPRWYQMANVPHGLRAVWGMDDFRVAAGNDGALYFGVGDLPFGKGVQWDRVDGTPAIPFAPIIGGVGGNSARHVVATLGFGGFMSYDGSAWRGYRHGVDLTRSFRSVWGLPGDELNVVIGANYYGLWRFRGSRDSSGAPIPTLQLDEQRDDPALANCFINAMWGQYIDRIIAVGTAGRFMVHQENVPPQVLGTHAGASDLWGVSGTSEEDLWVVGDRGTVLHGPLD